MNNGVDIDKLVSEVVRGIRGELSQSQVLKKLNIGHNAVAKWENGHIRIRWEQFIDLAIACKRPIKQASKSAYKYQGDLRDGRKFLQIVFGLHLSSDDLPKVKGLSSYKIKNIFLGKNDPFLDEIFALLSMNGLFIVWLSQIIEEAYWPSSVRDFLQLWEKNEKVISNYPLLIPTYLMLQHGILSGSMGAIAKNLAKMFLVSPKGVEAMLKEMILIKMAHEESGRILHTPAALPPAFRPASRDKILEMDQFWFNIFHKKFSNDQTNASAVRGIAISLGSDEDLDKISSLMRRLQGDVLKIEENSLKENTPKGIFTVQVHIGYSSLIEDEGESKS